jgi:threonine/homoserine efflux transporter RhtA
MLFTLFIAVLAAAIWTLLALFTSGSLPHDPSTLELAAMAGITVATYVWMRRLQAIRERTKSAFALDLDVADAESVPNRYAGAQAELQHEEAAESAEHVA